MIYNQMLSFAAGILVARVIGASQYGVVNVARNILEIFGIVSPLGLDLALQRHLGSGQSSTRLRQLWVFSGSGFPPPHCVRWGGDCRAIDLPVSRVRQYLARNAHRAPV